MNLMNAMWALFALCLNLIILPFIWMVIWPICQIMVTEGTAQYWVTYAGLFLMTIVFVFIIPVATAMSDEEGGIMKKLVTRG